MGDAVSFTIDWSRREVVAVSRDPTNALRIVAMVILIKKTDYHDNNGDDDDDFEHRNHDGND